MLFGIMYLLFAGLLSLTQGVREDNTGIPYAQEICDMPSLAPSDCNVFSKILVVIPTVGNVHAPNLVIKRRDLYITTRIKDQHGKQLGRKLRTNTGTKQTSVDPQTGTVRESAHSFEWKQAFVIPVTCPRSWTTDNMYHLEVNLKDEAAIQKFQLKNKEVAKVTLDIATMPANGRTALKLENNIGMQLQSEWCDDMACVDSFISKTLGMTHVKGSQIRHEGIDCGAGCHNALKKLRQTFVFNAMNNTLRSVERYVVYDKVVDDVDGDEEIIEDPHVFWEDYVADIEKKPPNNMEKAWAKLRTSMEGMPGVLEAACAGNMAILPKIKLTDEHRQVTRRQVFRVKTYLTDLNRELEGAVSCLRKRWFEGAFALAQGSRFKALQTADTCPVVRYA